MLTPLSSLVWKFSTRSTHASASAAEIAICFTEVSCEVFSNSRSSSRIARSLRTMFWIFVRSSPFIFKAASFRQLWKFFNPYFFEEGTSVRNNRESQLEANPLRRSLPSVLFTVAVGRIVLRPILMVSWLVVALDWWCVCFDISGTRPCRASCLSGRSLIFASGEPQFSALISLRQRACYP
jgi:hypothetical protein